MAYEIKDDTGNFVGPYDDSVIRGWLESGQMDKSATIREFGSGMVTTAGSLIKSATPPSQPSTFKPTIGVMPVIKPTFKEIMTADDGTGEFVGAVFFAILAIVICVMVIFSPTMPPLVGLSAAVGPAIYAYRCYDNGHDKANWAIGFAIAAGVLGVASFLIKMAMLSKR